MKKMLPIVMKPMVESECSVFEKLAIIQTSPHQEAWLASHLRLFYDSNYGNCRFGEWNALYTQDYYEDILQIEEVPIFRYPQDSVVEIIKQCIDDGFYALVEINWSEDAADPYYHEALFYGYDDDRELLFAPKTEESIWRESLWPYKQVRTAHRQFLAYLDEHPDHRLYYTTHYQYPFSKIRLRDTYSPSRAPYMAMENIVNEVWGKKIDIQDFDAAQAVLSHNRFYRGLACLMGMKDKLDRLIETPEPDSFLASGFIRLYEHRALLLLSMEYIEKAWEIEKEAVAAYIDDYRRCCDRAQKWYGMAFKYNRTEDIEILQRIRNEISTAYQQEYNTLCDFYSASHAWYCSHYRLIP